MWIKSVGFSGPCKAFMCVLYVQKYNRSSRLPSEYLFACSLYLVSHIVVVQVLDCIHNMQVKYLNWFSCILCRGLFVQLCTVQDVKLTDNSSNSLIKYLINFDPLTLYTHTHTHTLNSAMEWNIKCRGAKWNTIHEICKRTNERIDWPQKLPAGWNQQAIKIILLHFQQWAKPHSNQLQTDFICYSGFTTNHTHWLLSIG